MSTATNLKAAASAAAAFGEHRNHPMKGAHTNDVPHDDALFSKRERPLRPSGHRIRGVTTQAALRNYLSEETPMLTVEDVQDMCEKVVGLPLLKEHQAGEVLGRVARAWTDDKDRIVIEAELEDTPEGFRARNSVRSKRMGFSWGQRFGVRDTKDMPDSVEMKLPLELSLTESPEFDEDAWVTDVTENTPEHERLKRALTEPGEGEQKHPLEEEIIAFHGRLSGSARSRKLHRKKSLFFTHAPHLFFREKKQPPQVP